MVGKDPTPRSDALRAQREARYGHLQATTDKPKLMPYAGKERHQGGVPYTKTPRPTDEKPARKRRKLKRKTE